LRGSIGTEAH